MPSSPIAARDRQSSASSAVSAESGISSGRISGGLASAGGDDTSGTSRDEATGQLQSAALRFESEYPKLSMTMGEIMDALGKLGI